MHLSSTLPLVALVATTASMMDHASASPIFSPYYGGGGGFGFVPFFAANNNVDANQNALLANQNFATVNANNFEQDRIRDNRFSATAANSNLAAANANTAANSNVVALKRRSYIPFSPFLGGGITNTFGYSTPYYGAGTAAFGGTYGTSFGAGPYF
ncbi:MAG: hypothetical protein DHS80DRAFT_29793 [Piptocephalis tieghemiana]|nr:MAG: hypothetical protein DHS80DRAFT_29793 [Piptocephalis tieghemiana]